MENVLFESGHLHLPGFQVVEDLALLLLKLMDDTEHRIIPVDLRQEIGQTGGSLEDHDHSNKNFQQFGWARYPQAAQITWGVIPSVSADQDT